MTEFLLGMTFDFAVGVVVDPDQPEDVPVSSERERY